MSGPASGEAVERLHDAFCVLTELIEEFPAEDKVALYDAAQAVMDVGLKHDEAGGYRIFFQSQARDDALNTKNERTN